MQARFNSSKGFSLAEVLVSMGLLTTVSLGVAQLFAISTRATYIARGQTSTTAMAEQKMEQLRALTDGAPTDLIGSALVVRLMRQRADVASRRGQETVALRWRATADTLWH